MDLTWLIEPFQTWNAGVVFWWYAGTMAATFSIYFLHKLAGVEFNISHKLEDIPGGFLVIVIGFIVPFLEEIIFRGIPAFLDTSMTFWIAATAVWVLLHGRRFLFIIPMGVLFLKLWLSGFWIEAIVIHSLHNTFLVSIFLLSNELENADDYLDLESDSTTVTKIKGNNSKITIQTE